MRNVFLIALPRLLSVLIVLFLNTQDYMHTVDGPVTGAHRLARITSGQTSSAIQPFATIPNSNLGTRVQPEIWVTMIDIRTGNAIFDGDRQCPRCTLGHYRNPPLLDKMGYHAFICPGMEGTLRRHNQLRDKLATTLSHRPIAVSPSIEYPLIYDREVLGKGPGEQRRMDIMIDNLLS